MMNRLKPVNTSTAPSDTITGRKKVTLAPGHSLMDWIRLGRKGDLSGVGSDKKLVTPSELAMHNTQQDMWMSIRGKVYNVTPYQDFHPGGIDELMRGAGRDGTRLFDEVHNWVNVESMLEKCLVGPLEVSGGGANQPGKYMKPRHASLGTSIDPPKAKNPRQDWYQRDNEVIVTIYTRHTELNDRFVIVDIKEKELFIIVTLKDQTYYVHMNPKAELLPDCRVEVSSTGKVEVFFTKAKPDDRWESLGTPLPLNEKFMKTKLSECKFREWTVVSNTIVSHDTRLIHLHAPVGLRMIPPIGYHVHIKSDISGMEISRSYTTIAPSLTKPFSDPDYLQGKSLYLMVKRYSGGALSPWLCDVKEGDKVQISNYDGDFNLKNLEKASYLTMFAAGTGFTSMICLILHVLYQMTNPIIPVKLMFYNKTKKDILWNDELNKLQAAFPDRFSVTHVLSQEPDKTWKGLRGRICEEHVRPCVTEMMKTPNPFLCICGPWAYNDLAESLAKLSGLSKEQIYIFTQNY